MHPLRYCLPRLLLNWLLIDLWTMSLGRRDQGALLAIESVELMRQAARFLRFEGSHFGLRDREWMALRFLSRANRFSRNHASLAAVIDATRATASNIVKTLELKSLIVRRPSPKDKRSILLEVTPHGQKWLNQHDPANIAVEAVARLGSLKYGDLRTVLSRLLGHLQARQPDKVGICQDCMFLAETVRRKAMRGDEHEYICRLHRATISSKETALLCTSYEQISASSTSHDDFRPLSDTGYPRR